MKTAVFTILAAVICSGLFAQEIPLKISYQGKLLENGSPVTGTKSITFTIGSWSETKTVTVTDGLYTVTLGETTVIPVTTFDNTSTVTLQITVAGSPLSPVTDILSVPYAYKAQRSVNTEQIADKPVSTTAPTTNQVLKWNGTSWAPATVTDNDNQTLSVSGSNLTISGGNTVTIPSSSPWTQTGTDIYYNSGKVAIGTNNPATLNALVGVTGSGLDMIRSKQTGIGNAGLFESTGSSSDPGVEILANSTSEALYVQSYGQGHGALIESTVSSGLVYGLRAETYSSNTSAKAIYGVCSGGFAGYFNGNVDVNGTLSKSAGSFKIDHPLDPENKYLVHSFVESPDMMNVYNGNVLLDSNGEAVIELPDWFEALNKEYHYQLTCIGGYASVYIAKEITGNQFKIAGGKAGLKVSWQVTGVRKDPYAEQNRIQVEVEKSEKEKGYYRNYKAYNQPKEKSIDYAEDLEVLKKIIK